MPMCVAPSRTSPRIEYITPRTAATSSPSRFFADGIA
jgi:hypothetical protein